MSKSEITDYQLNAIHKKSVHFKGGTSYILPRDSQLPTEFAVKAGFGLAELINVGFRFQSDKFKMGLSAGFIPGKDRTMYSFAGDLYFHIGHAWRASNKQPWCARTGLNYLRDETDNFKDTYLLLNLRAGKDIPISNKLGIEFYFGLMIRVYYEHLEKVQSTWNLDIYDGPVIPSGGIGIFYAL